MMLQRMRVQAGDVYRAQGMKGLGRLGRLGQDDGDFSAPDIGSTDLPSYTSEPVPVDLTGPGYGTGTGIDLQPTMEQLVGPENATLTDSVGNPVSQTSVPITSSVTSAAAALSNANSSLAALTAAGANAAQIAVAKSQQATALAAYNASLKVAAGTSTCAQTLVSGMCNTTLYMVGAVCGLFVMVGLMSGNPKR